MESFDGSLGGVAGTFNFAHLASTRGADRFDEALVIVPGSGTGGLADIGGSGGPTEMGLTFSLNPHTPQLYGGTQSTA